MNQVPNHSASQFSDQGASSGIHQEFLLNSQMLKSVLMITIEAQVLSGRETRVRDIETQRARGRG